LIYRFIPVFSIIVLVILYAPAALGQDTPVCAACGEKVSGDFFETEGVYYHAKCFRCDFCGKPIPDSFIRYQGKNYHSSCFENNIALRCDVCGDIITGKYISNFWGNSYHPEHDGKEIQCSFCRRFITGEMIEGTIKFKDGRHLCSHCVPTAVFESEQAKVLMREVAGWLADFGLKVDPRPIEVHLVNKDALRRLASGASKNSQGFVDVEVTQNMSGEIQKQSFRMYLLYGMPRAQMIGTIAHELTHVWQLLNGGQDENEAISEGSCNYSVYLVLQKIGTDQADFMIDNMLNDTGAVYGKGLKQIKRYAEANGLEGWRRLMKERPQGSGMQMK